MLQWECGLKSVAAEKVARLGTVASEACDLGWSVLNGVFPEDVSLALDDVPLSSDVLGVWPLLPRPRRLVTVLLAMYGV